MLWGIFSCLPLASVPDKGKMQHLELYPHIRHLLFGECCFSLFTHVLVFLLCKWCANQIGHMECQSSELPHPPLWTEIRSNYYFTDHSRKKNKIK
jgi:hypothetical protein